VPAGNGFPQRMPPQGRPGVGVHPRDLEQVHLCLGTVGISVTDPRRYALSLMNTILGGNMSSRLFQEIRERLGLAYAVYCFVNSHVDSGMFGIYAGVDPARLEEALAAIVGQLRRLKENRIDPAELDAAKEFTKGNLLLASESNDNQMVRLAQNEIHFNRFVPLESVLASIDAVTAEEIHLLAEELFQEDLLALTVLGPVDSQRSLEGVLGL